MFLDGYFIEYAEFRPTGADKTTLLVFVLNTMRTQRLKAMT